MARGRGHVSPTVGRSRLAHIDPLCFIKAAQKIHRSRLIACTAGPTGTALSGDLTFNLCGGLWETNLRRVFMASRSPCHSLHHYFVGLSYEFNYA